MCTQGSDKTKLTDLMLKKENLEYLLELIDKDYLFCIDFVDGSYVVDEEDIEELEELIKKWTIDKIAKIQVKIANKNIDF